MMVATDRRSVKVVNILRSDKVHETVEKYGVSYDQPLIFSKISHELNQV